MNQKLNNLATYIHYKVLGSNPPRGFLRSLLLLLFVVIVATYFYSHEEKWSLIDSMYFTVITLTTVGYGDLHPTTPLSKLFTIGLIFSGIGIALTVINSFAVSIKEGSENRTRIWKSFFDYFRRNSK
jgi:voltage-gated potassium channel Kch